MISCSMWKRSGNT